MHTRTRGTEKFRLEEGGTRNTKRRRNSKRSGVVPLPRWGAVRRKSVPAGRSPSRGRSKRDHVAIRSHPTVLSPRTLLLLSLSLSLCCCCRASYEKIRDEKSGRKRANYPFHYRTPERPPPSSKVSRFSFLVSFVLEKRQEGEKKRHVEDISMARNDSAIATRWLEISHLPG